MKKHTMKKLISLALSVLFVLSMSMPALAAAEAADGYTITVKPADTTKTPSGEATDTGLNARFNAYAVFIGDLAQPGADGKGGYVVSPDGSPVSNYLANVKWGNGITEAQRPAFVKSLLEGESEFSTALKAAFEAANPAIVEKDYAGDTVAKIIADTLGAHPEYIDSFARLSFAAMNADKASEKAVSTWDTTEKRWKIQVQNAGFYLIVDTVKTNGTDETDTASAFMMGVYGNQLVEMKPDRPDVDKKIIEKSDDKDGVLGDVAGMPDTVMFRLTGGPLPENYEQFTTYKFVFHDTLSKGLTYTGDANLKVFVVNTVTDAAGEKTTTKVEIPAKSAGVTNYTVTATKNSDNGNTALLVTLEDMKKIDVKDSTGKPVVFAAGTNIVVEYTATLNGDAVITDAGNPNQVYLEYSNNPSNDGTGKTTTKTVYVYDFALDITKVGDNDPDVGLAGAGFTLTKAAPTAPEADAATVLYATFKEGKDDDGNSYIYIDKWVDNTDTYLEKDYTLFSDAEGKIKVRGLDSGVEYTLTETVTPSGYNTMAPFAFKIEAEIAPDTGRLVPSPKVVLVSTGRDDVKLKEVDGDTTGDRRGEITITSDVNDTNLEGALTLVNNRAPYLPGTGGIGRIIFYVVGGLLLAGALTFIVLSGRKKSQK